MAELRHLRAFVAVAEERNFTRAAERLHVAQQAVSKTVRQLERELGVELLARTTREVALTAAGAALLDGARDALASADAALVRAREAGRGLTGTVRLGVSPAVGPAATAEVVAALRAGAEELTVSVYDVRPGDVVRGLRDRDVDLVLARTLPGTPDVDRCRLRPTPLVLAVPAGHRLAGERRVALAELDGERLLVWNPPGTPYTDLLLAPLAAAGVRVACVESRVIGGGRTLGELAARKAVALVPSGWAPEPGVVEVELRDAPAVPLLLAWLAGRPPPAAARVRERLGA